MASFGTERLGYVVTDFAYGYCILMQPNENNKMLPFSMISSGVEAQSSSPYEIVLQFVATFIYLFIYLSIYWGTR
jgi:hypothetical protein